MKKISFGKEALDKMVKGMDIAAECVSGTIGPRGLNVIFLRQLNAKHN